MSREDSQIAEADVVDYDPETGAPVYVLHGDDVYRCVLVTQEELREEAEREEASR